MWEERRTQCSSHFIWADDHYDDHDNSDNGNNDNEDDGDDDYDDDDVVVDVAEEAR